MTPELKQQTCTLHRYQKCIVLEGEYEGQEVECSNAVNDVFRLTSLSTGYEAPKTLKVKFLCDGMEPIDAELFKKRLYGQVALYERI